MAITITLDEAHPVSVYFDAVNECVILTYARRDSVSGIQDVHTITAWMKMPSRPPLPDGSPPIPPTDWLELPPDITQALDIAVTYFNQLIAASLTPPVLQAMHAESAQRWQARLAASAPQVS